MVTGKLEGDILYLVIKGDLVAEEVIAETNRWIVNPERYRGMITDVREMKRTPIAEQKRLEEQRKRNGLNKPHAILGKDSAFAALVDIFIQFTRAANTRYFTDVEQAKQWIRSARK